MLILTGIMPVAYALNPGATEAEIVGVAEVATNVNERETVTEKNEERHRNAVQHCMLKPPAIRKALFPGSAGSTTPSSLPGSLTGISAAKTRFRKSPERSAGRGAMKSCVWTRQSMNFCRLEPSEEARESLVSWRSRLAGPTEYAPYSDMIAVPLSVGFGTMIGWEPIVVTVGEAIGKSR